MNLLKSCTNKYMTQGVDLCTLKTVYKSRKFLKIYKTSIAYCKINYCIYHLAWIGIKVMSRFIFMKLAKSWIRMIKE